MTPKHTPADTVHQLNKVCDSKQAQVVCADSHRLGPWWSLGLLFSKREAVWAEGQAAREPKERVLGRTFLEASESSACGTVRRVGTQPPLAAFSA